MPHIRTRAWTTLDISTYIKEQLHDVPNQQKKGVLIFVYQPSRAVHVEYLEGLETVSFKNAFSRFVWIRDACKLISPDQGTNLICARKRWQILIWKTFPRNWRMMSYLDTQHSTCQPFFRKLGNKVICCQEDIRRLPSHYWQEKYLPRWVLYHIAKSIFHNKSYTIMDCFWPLQWSNSSNVANTTGTCRNPT